MSTSGTYNFGNTELNTLIDMAFGQCGKPLETITSRDRETARFHSNILLSSWINESVPLWSIKRNQLLSLISGKSEYRLANGVIDLLEVSLRKSIRQVTGTPFSNEGIAANAFDGNPLTACTQTNGDGYIGFDYGVNVQKQILMLGIKSNELGGHSIQFEVSNDNANWDIVLDISYKLYKAGEIYWFYIDSPKAGRYFRIKEYGGYVLNIQELYFNDNITDILFSPISRNEYYSQPSKFTSGTPLSYVVNREVSPTVTFWPVPSDSDISQCNCIFYNAKMAIQDAGIPTNSIEMPQRFYQSFIFGLSAQLAPQYAFDRIDKLCDLYTNSFAFATNEDTEKGIPISVELTFPR